MTPKGQGWIPRKAVGSPLGMYMGEGLEEELMVSETHFSTHRAED